MSSLIRSFLVTVALVGCTHLPQAAVDDGSRGTRVTNPRIAPWAFYRADRVLTVGQRVEAGDVLETACAHDSCTAEHRYLSVWQVIDGHFIETTPAVSTHPERERRIKLQPGVDFVVVAWTREPLAEAPRLDLRDGTRKGPHSQTELHDDDGRVVGVVQWGPVDAAR